MHITIQNEFIKAVVHPIGAELQELKDLKTGINYLWNGNPAYWGKFSPVLFPIVGTLKENTYFYKGHQYSLPRHGFARERSFECIDKSPQSVSFLLSDDASTRELYPFRFQLAIRYTLLDNLLSCNYMIRNTDEDDIYFSIGAHPAFAVPLHVSTQDRLYDDYYLEFSDSIALHRYKLENGLIGTTTETIKLDSKKLPLNQDLFRDDAIVLKNLPDTSIRIGSVNHSNGLEFGFHDFPFFGIWAAPGAPFVCLEPWCGIADSVNHNQELTEKEGIVRLPKGEVFERQWTVKIY